MDCNNISVHLNDICVDFKNENKHVITSEWFLEVHFFSFTHKGEAVWPDGTHPMSYVE